MRDRVVVPLPPVPAMSQGLSLGHGRFRSVMIRRSMAETQRIRVLVVDDHRMFTDALTAVLDQDGRFEVVGTAATGREAVRSGEDCRG